MTNLGNWSKLVTKTLGIVGTIVYNVYMVDNEELKTIVRYLVFEVAD